MKKIIFSLLFVISVLFQGKTQAIGVGFELGGGDGGPGISVGIGAPYYDPYYDTYPVYADERWYYE